MENKLWQHIQQVRSQSPLVYNITNFVVMNNTANALLAVGASPIMSHAHSEIKDMSNICQALVVNIGTLDEYWVESMVTASAACHELGKPWVLDPVGAGATSFRNITLQQLLRHKPTVIRGNASEIMALANVSTITTKGVESTESSSNAIEAAQKLSNETNAIICISGAIDYIIYRDKLVEVHNGHAMMTKVTGLGCSASAIIGAFIAIADDILEATVAAVSLLSIAGELAQQKANGPGTLQLHLLDMLYQLDEATFKSTVNINIV